MVGDTLFVFSSYSLHSLNSYLLLGIMSLVCFGGVVDLFSCSTIPRLTGTFFLGSHWVALRLKGFVVHYEA